MSLKMEEELRKIFGDDVVDIIHDSMRRLGIDLNPTTANQEQADKMIVLFMIQQTIQTAINGDMNYASVIEILKELVIINEKLYQSAVMRAKMSSKSTIN